MPAYLRPQREILENGVVMLWNEHDDTESVAVRGYFPAGAAREAPEEIGLAGFTARLLRRGTEQRDAQQIAAVAEDLGASFAAWGSTEEAGFSVKCLRRDLGTMLDLLGETLQHPTFAEEEIRKTREELFTQLREQEDSTRAQADLRMHELLYPAGHPYARSTIGTRETLSALGREDFRRFHAAYYGAEGMRLSVVGAVDPDVARERVGRWFAGKAPVPPQPDLRVAASGEPRRAAVSLPHKSQVDLVIAGPAIPRLHPDFYALSMVNLILGSLGLMGRLGERIRERHGMAYYVYSQVAGRSWSGEWAAHAGVAPENVERTISAVLDEVKRIRKELVTETELADACDYLIGSLPLRLETNDGVAASLLNAEYFGLGLDYLERYPGYIRAETRESLRQAARDYLDPDRFSIAMAGPV
jgi:zinc protease